MEEQVWKRNELDSPCIKLCIIHEEKGLCIGCYRTIFEIADWSKLSSEVRNQIILELPDRGKKMLAYRRGGRKRREKG